MRYEITGPDNLDLSTLEASALRAIDVAVTAGAQMVANDAKRAIASGPKTGRLYEFYYRTNPKTGGIFPVEKRWPMHRASAPGEAPATDTGRLINSIVTAASFNGTTKFHGIVEVRTEYARFLEYGTRKIAPRPFLIPAVEKNRQRIHDTIRLALATATAQFARKQGSHPGAFPGSEVRTELESRFWAWRFRD